MEYSVKFVISYRMNISSLQYVPGPKFEAETDISLTVNDKKGTINSKLTPGIVPGLPNIDFTAIHPQGKSRLFLFLQVRTNFLQFNSTCKKVCVTLTTNTNKFCQQYDKTIYHTLVCTVVEKEQFIKQCAKNVC